MTKTDFIDATFEEIASSIALGEETRWGRFKRKVLHTVNKVRNYVTNKIRSWWSKFNNFLAMHRFIQTVVQFTVGFTIGLAMIFTCTVLGALIAGEIGMVIGYIVGIILCYSTAIYLFGY